MCVCLIREFILFLFPLSGSDSQCVLFHGCMFFPLAPHPAELPLPFLPGPFRIPPEENEVPPTVLADHVQEQILERASVIWLAFQDHAQLVALTGVEFSSHGDAVRRAVTDNVITPWRAQRSWALVRLSNAARHHFWSEVVSHPG